MKNWKSLMLSVAMLVMLSSVHAALGQSPQQQTSSVKSSPKSDIRATERRNAGSLPASETAGHTQAGSGTPLGDAPAGTPRPRSDPTAACMAAVEELAASRTLIDALESENTVLRARLATEKQLTVVLTELNETRTSETDALRATVAAKNETIAAKDAVIAEQDKLVEALKSKKRSPWRRIGDLLIGAAVFAILK